MGNVGAPSAKPHCCISPLELSLLAGNSGNVMSVGKAFMDVPQKHIRGFCTLEHLCQSNSSNLVKLGKPTSTVQTSVFTSKRDLGNMMNVRKVPFQLEMYKTRAEKKLRNHLVWWFSAWWGHLYNHTCALPPHAVTDGAGCHAWCRGWRLRKVDGYP